METRSLVFTSLLLISLVQPARAIVEFPEINTPTLAQTDPRLQEADRLEQQVIQLYQQGRYAEGIAIAQQGNRI